MVDPNRISEEISLEEEELEKEPLGENNLSSFAMFNERRRYKTDIYPIYTVPTPYDFWYDENKKYFGKLNEDGYTLVAREKYLTQASGSMNGFALDFVIDAYNDFKEKYTFLNKQQSEGTPFQELKVKTGWRSSAVDYNEYLNGIFRLFVDDFMFQENRDQKMINFNTFLELFYQFIDESEGNMPINYSTFIKSNYCSPQSSGLMLELTTDPHGNDKDKYNNFIKNINFECYARTAAEFGFRIDKNYPGRIVADLKSVKMQEYMANYPKRPNDPFNGTDPIPNEPEFNPPINVEALKLESPFQTGDTVEAVIIRPQNPADPYYIIGGYTDLINQKFGVGVRPITRDSVNGEQINAFQYMIDNLLPEGRATKVFFKLADTIPQGTRLLTTPSTTTIAPIVAPTLFLPVPGGARKAVIIGVENSFVGGLSNFFPESTSISLRYIDFQNYLENGLSSPVFIPSPQRNTGGIRYLSQLPIQAIHLSNAVQQPTSTIKRYEEYFIERNNRALAQEKLQEYRTFVYEPLYRKYEQELAAYEKVKENYQNELRLYDLLPKPMSYYNVINSRYNLGYQVDVNMLKEALMQFYFSYASSRPTAFIKEDSRCGTNTPKTKRRTVQREQISQKIINEKYNDRRFWIKTYAEIKRAEMKKKIKRNVFDNMLFSALAIYKLKGENESLRFITDQFNKYS